MIRIGVDVGGTFTDFAAWRSDPATLTTYKVPSTPPTFVEGFKAGLEEVLRVLPPEAGEPVIVMHGTTISTNTVIERNGSPVALFVTKGFRDLLELQRFRLQDPIRIDAGRTRPLVPRNLTYEIDERLEPDGSVTAPLDVAGLRAAVAEAKAARVGAIAVCFLHAFRHPDHENTALEIIREEAPELGVSLSSRILPRIGEYERAVACVLNAYVQARMAGYLAQMESFLAERLPGSRLFITRSNGGAMAAFEAGNFPIHTLLSGPASGVTAARFLDDAHRGKRRSLTMDMGGTSTDIALIFDGQPTVTNDAEVGDFPLTMPVTGIEAVGAGGGSIAWLDAGILRVGPKSAGAWPGPAAFGRGGELPTVTDAYVLTGLVDPARFLGGRMTLDVAAARAAFAPLAETLGMSVEAAAEACLAIATSNIVARALPYFARHGVDQEDLTLIVFGGAGSLHGPMLAAELGIRRILIPRTPSVFCAFGGLVSEVVEDAVAPVYGVDVDEAILAREFAGLTERVNAWLAAQVDPADKRGVTTEYWAEIRYLGQFFSLNVELDEAAALAGDLAAVEDAFRAEYARLYGGADAAGAIEILELRVRISGALPRPELSAVDLVAAIDAMAPQATRAVRIAGTVHEDAPVRRRDDLAPGETLEGPAIIEQNDTTILVMPGYVAEIRPTGDLLMVRR